MPLNKKEADTLIEAIAKALHRFVGDEVVVSGELPKPLTLAGANKIAENVPTPKTAPSGNGSAPFDKEALYQEFRARIIDDARFDPILLKLLVDQPEIIVDYERRTETLDGSSLRGRIAKLIADGFLDEPKTNGNIVSELRRIGTEPNSGNVSRMIADLIASGLLTRVGSDKYQRAPGIKITKNTLEVLV